METNVRHGQKALISGVKNDGTLFIFGSIEGYCKQNNLSAGLAMERALRNGHEIAWATPESIAIVDSSTYPGYYEAREKELAEALRLKSGDVIRLEGRAYRLEPDWNRNVKLVPAVPGQEEIR